MRLSDEVGLNACTIKPHAVMWYDNILARLESPVNDFGQIFICNLTIIWLCLGI